MKRRLIAISAALGMTVSALPITVLAESTEAASEAIVSETETETESANPITVKAVSGAEKIKVLLLPTFEVGTLDDENYGEAELLYQEYCKDGEEYQIAGSLDDSKLYVKDGVALYVTGMGKANASISLTSILNDDRFDFSDTYIINSGCAGSAIDYGTMGDVYIITAAVDYDLGHKADIREMTDQDSETTWYHDSGFDSSSVKILDASLTDQAYNAAKDVKIETTDLTRKIMGEEFDNAEWAVRDPMVLKGTTVTGDNYWKGYYDHANAKLIVETYNCPDPYVTTEMESMAFANVAARYNLLDHFLAIRDSVNTDVFMGGNTPGSLWGDEVPSVGATTETADIFPVAMENGYKVTKAVVDAILSGKISN